VLKQIFILLFCVPVFALGQKQVSMEQYYYMQPRSMGFIVPKISYQGTKGWYAEARYNYEEIKTGSAHFGKKFSFGNKSNFQVTPLVGVCFGALNGASVGSFVEFSFNRFDFFSEPQYVHSFKDSSASYFYSWSEALYNFSSSFYGGFALQQTKVLSQSNFFEPGLVGGCSIKNFDIPLYCFNIFNRNKNFVLGVNWKWEK
jgi:hypothetical protein